MHHVYMYVKPYDHCTVIRLSLINTIMPIIPTPLYPPIRPINVIACIDGISNTQI